MSIKHRLGKLTKTEKSFLDSRDGRTLETVLDDFEKEPPQTRLIEAIDRSFSRLSDIFQRDRIFTGRQQSFQAIGKTITADSFSSQFHVHLNPDYRYGSNRHSFNVLTSSINTNMCSLVERALPVRIGKKHTENRFKERTTLEGALDNENLLHVLAVATTYVRLCDKKTDWKKFKEVPFAIAGKNGLFLGVVVPTEERQHYNRLYFSAVARGDEPPISPYDWLPKASAEIRTFIGFKEFKPAQHALYKTLRKYVNEQTQAALTYGVFSYQNTTPNGTDTSNLAKDYNQAEELLRGLSQSKTWKSGVRAPNMQYLGNGVIKPRI